MRPNFEALVERFSRNELSVRKVAAAGAVKEVRVYLPVGQVVQSGAPTTLNVQEVADESGRGKNNQSSREPASVSSMVPITHDKVAAAPSCFAAASAAQSGVVKKKKSVSFPGLVEKAAPEAQLGAVKEKPQGGEVNYAEAIRFYDMAIERVHIAAIYRRALMHKDGLGGKVNNEGAMRLFKQSSHPKAPRYMRKIEERQAAVSTTTPPGISFSVSGFQASFFVENASVQKTWKRLDRAQSQRVRVST